MRSSRAASVTAARATPGEALPETPGREARELAVELHERDARIARLEEALATTEARAAASEAAVAELSEQIDAIYRSRGWRLLKQVRAVALPLLRLLSVRLYFGSTLFARPESGLEATATDGGITEWATTGDDPSFALVWAGRHPLAAGRYRLRLQMPDGGDQLVLPRLYVDSGDGFNEGELIELHLRPAGEGELTAQVALPRGALGLRFDPSVAAAGTLALGRIRLRRISRLERYGGIAAKLTAPYLKSPLAGMRAAGRALRALATGGGGRLLADLRATEMYSLGDYEAWIERNDRLTEADLTALRRRLAALEDPPLLSVLLPVYETPERLLRETIESVRGQIYERWELCLANDGSSAPHVRGVLESYARADPRIRVAHRDERGHIARATNTAFEMATGTWVALLDHDDLLRPHALAEVALELDRHPDAELIYSDEDKIDAEGRRDSPYFKPDFSRELLRSQNYLNHLTVHRAENVRAAGGWRPGFEGSQDYDLTLRILERIDLAKIRHIPKILYHWRAVEGSAASSGEAKGYAHTAGLRALEEHVARLGLAATAEAAPGTPFYRLRFAVPDPPPLVSLVIPTRDSVELLRRCVESIRERTTYGSYEILIVDNGSIEPATQSYLGELEADPVVRVLAYNRPFNYSAINNFAVGHARGELVGLVNNDVVVISPDWLTEMVSWAVQPDVGCVGAKLYYGNDTIQHAGVILGLGGVAGHSHKYFPRDHDGYLHRLKLVQNLSAVTAACLLVRKRVYEEVGGLNEKDLPVAFNDVDFCIRVRDAGYWNVWTPYAELYHLESTSRGDEDNPAKRARAKGERIYMQQRWRSALQNDPYYSPHLTRAEENFSLGI